MSGTYNLFQTLQVYLASFKSIFKMAVMISLKTLNFRYWLGWSLNYFCHSSSSNRKSLRVAHAAFFKIICSDGGKEVKTKLKHNFKWSISTILLKHQ